MTNGMLRDHPALRRIAVALGGPIGGLAVMATGISIGCG